MFSIIIFVCNYFQVITEDLERRVEELKKEYDHAKEKARAAIVHPVVPTEVVAPPPSNGIAVSENISSTTPIKYAFGYFQIVTEIYLLIILHFSYRKPIKKRSRSRTPSETKSGSRSPRHLKKSKKRK